VLCTVGVLCAVYSIPSPNKSCVQYVDGRGRAASRDETIRGGGLAAAAGSSAAAPERGTQSAIASPPRSEPAPPLPWPPQTTPPCWQVLAQKLQQDWTWLSDTASSYQDEGNTRLRTTVRVSREAVQAVVSSVQSGWAAAEAGLALAQQPSETMQRYKVALLDFRRRYPAALVGAAAAIALVPAVLLKHTSRLERARLVLRNLVLGGGTASVLLYPEFVMRVANNVESAATKVEQRVGASRP
jgi:hypothetical protein